MPKSKKPVTTMSVTELFRMFPDDKTCYEWLEQSRWGDQPVCPHCGGTENITPSPSKLYH